MRPLYDFIDDLLLTNSVISVLYYSEVPNRRADRNKRAGLEKKFHPACFFTKKVNRQAGANFLFITWKIASRVERKSEKSKRAGLEESATLLAYLLSKLINPYMYFLLLVQK